MKFTIAIAVAILAFTANAAAIAEPEPFCHRPGEPCTKIKRMASALADAFAEPIEKRDADANPVAIAHCHRPGEPCTKAKRHAYAMAEAVAAAHPEPLAFLASLNLRDAFPEAEPMPDAGKFSPNSLIFET